MITYDTYETCPALQRTIRDKTVEALSYKEVFWGTLIKTAPFPSLLVNIGSPGAAHKSHNQQYKTDKGEGEGVPLSGVLDHFD